MIVGFFVTLVLAWYHGERGAQRVTGTELLILALLLAIGGGFLWRSPALRAPSPPSRPSVRLRAALGCAGRDPGKIDRRSAV